MSSTALDAMRAALEIAAEQAGKRILVVESMGELEIGDHRPDFDIIVVTTPLDLIRHAQRLDLFDRLEPLLLEIPTKVYVHERHPPITDMEELAAKIAVEGREERESRPFHFETKAQRRKALRGKKR